MNIRQATESDITTLATLFHQTVLTHAPQYYTPEQTEVWASSANQPDYFRAFILQATTFVATEATEILGFAGLATDGHITATYVRHDALHQGIGSQLMQHLLTQAKSQKIERLYAEASHFSLGLFQKFGFQLYSTEIIERQNVEFKRFLVELHLTDKNLKSQ